MSARLTPTSTLLNPMGMAFGTIGRSLHDAAISGATNPSAPPFAVTFGLPIADDPWLPGYGIGGISSLIHVDHFVYAAKLPLIVSHTPPQLDVSTPVTSFTNLPVAESGFTNRDAMPEMARFASSVSATSISAFGTFNRWRRQYPMFNSEGGVGTPIGMWQE